jgi:hypothetical protein
VLYWLWLVEVELVVWARLVKLKAKIKAIHSELDLGGKQTQAARMNLYAGADCTSTQINIQTYQPRRRLVVESRLCETRSARTEKWFEIRTSGSMRAAITMTRIRADYSSRAKCKPVPARCDQREGDQAGGLRLIGRRENRADISGEGAYQRRRRVSEANDGRSRNLGPRPERGRRTGRYNPVRKRTLCDMRAVARLTPFASARDGSHRRNAFVSYSNSYIAITHAVHR